jgi:hypothetical protein
MMRTVARKVMWVGRATVFLVGFAVILAAVLGLASAVLAGTGVGAAFNLGKTNTVNRLSQLVGSTDNPMLRVTNKSSGTGATALTLQVQPGHAPMRVDSDTRVAGLNADRLDGKDSSEIGLHGLERVYSISALNSDSPKHVSPNCPSGKVIVGTGASISGGTSGTPPNEQTDVVITDITPTSALGHPLVFVEAYEESLTSADWRLIGYAICAIAP